MKSVKYLIAVLSIFFSLTNLQSAKEPIYLLEYRTEWYLFPEAPHGYIFRLGKLATCIAQGKGYVKHGSDYPYIGAAVNLGLPDLVKLVETNQKPELYILMIPHLYTDEHVKKQVHPETLIALFSKHAETFFSTHMRELRLLKLIKDYCAAHNIKFCLCLPLSFAWVNTQDSLLSKLSYGPYNCMFAYFLHSKLSGISRIFFRGTEEELADHQKETLPYIQDLQAFLNKKRKKNNNKDLVPFTFNEINQLLDQHAKKIKQQPKGLLSGSKIFNHDDYEFVRRLIFPCTYIYPRL